MTDAWDDIAGWWMDAVRDDPSQSTDTHELLDDLTTGTSGLTLDLGCGEGQGMRLLGTGVIGADVSASLLREARGAGPVVQARLPDLSWVRSHAVDRVVSVGLLDLIADHETFFAETARVVRPAGHLAVVINHPVATSPGSASLVDPDGEILWRWGTYLTRGSLPQDVEGRTVELIHRPLGELLTAAADAGWSLETLIERGPSAATIDRFPEMRGHHEIPALAGLRWRWAGDD
jgi:SAM-dependent methyltransferase